MANRRSGFTLIELIVVIGILGILATGLLAAVDPFEQLKKGRDSSARGSVVELHNAFIRYYATHATLPWNNVNTAVSTCTGLSSNEAIGVTVVSDNDENIETPMESCIKELIGDGELKEDFVSALGRTGTDIYVFSQDAADLNVCFPPQSLSVYNDKATAYNKDGSNNSDSKDTSSPGAKTHYWCAK